MLILEFLSWGKFLDYYAFGFEMLLQEYNPD